MEAYDTRGAILPLARVNQDSSELGLNGRVRPEANHDSTRDRPFCSGWSRDQRRAVLQATATVIGTLSILLFLHVSPQFI